MIPESSSDLLPKVANFLEKLGKSQKIVDSDSVLKYVHMRMNDSGGGIKPKLPTFRRGTALFRFSSKKTKLHEFDEVPSRS